MTMIHTFRATFFLILLIILTAGSPITNGNEAPPSKRILIHKVKEGEILLNIANRYGVSYSDVLSENKIDNPSHILVGQKIRIPTDGISIEPDLPAEQDEIIHVVKEGEILLEISRKYGVAYDSILAANRIKDPSHILVGQKILVPTGSLSKETSKNLSASSPTIKFSTRIQDKEKIERKLAKTPKEESPAQNKIHVVQNGETLISIARTYNTDLDAIISANNIENSALIAPGLEIVVPSDAPPFVEPSLKKEEIESDLEETQEKGTNVKKIAPQTAQTESEEEDTSTIDPIETFEPSKNEEESQISTQQNLIHTIQKGEYLTQIARQYDVTVDSILLANQIENPSHVEIGRKIIIPTVSPFDSEAEDEDELPEQKRGKPVQNSTKPDFPLSGYLREDSVLFMGTNEGIDAFATITEIKEYLQEESNKLINYIRFLVLVHNRSNSAIYISPQNVTLVLSSNKVVSPFLGKKLASGELLFFPKILEYNGGDLSQENVIIQRLKKGDSCVLELTFSREGIMDKTEIFNSCKQLDLRVAGEKTTHILLTFSPAFFGEN